MIRQEKITVLLIIALALGGITEASANPNIKSNFISLYDIEETKLDTCRTCMSSTSPPVSWNQFGTDLRSEPEFNRNDPAQGLKNIESKDSDRDGFTNIDEINALTFPGDPDDSPAPTATITPPEGTELEETPAPTATIVETTAEESPGFELVLAASIISAVYIFRRRTG